MNIDSSNNFSDKSDQFIRKSVDMDAQRLQEIVLHLNNEVQQLSVLKLTIFGPNFDLADEVKNYEIRLIEIALKASGGKQTSAVKLLGTKKSTLNAKIKRYNICLDKEKF